MGACSFPAHTLILSLVVDPFWQPSEAGSLFQLVLDGRGAVYIGGQITAVSGQTRMYAAALPIDSTVPVDVFLDGFDG